MSLVYQANFVQLVTNFLLSMKIICNICIMLHVWYYICIWGDGFHHLHCLLLLLGIYLNKKCHFCFSVISCDLSAFLFLVWTFWNIYIIYVDVNKMFYLKFPKYSSVINGSNFLRKGQMETNTHLEAKNIQLHTPTPTPTQKKSEVLLNNTVKSNFCKLLSFPPSSEEANIKLGL